MRTRDPVAELLRRVGVGGDESREQGESYAQDVQKA